MMITPIITHLKSRMLGLLFLTLTFSSLAIAQSPSLRSYGCACDDALPTGVMSFIICTDGDPADMIDLRNSIGLYSDETLSNALPAIAPLTFEAGTPDQHCLRGFAPGTPTVLPEGLVVLNGVVDDGVLVAFNTCQLPQSEIVASAADPKFCTGAEICFDVNVTKMGVPGTVGVLGGYNWTAPGSSIPMSNTPTNTICLEFDNTGSYIISASGTDVDGCDFAAQLLVEINNLATNVSIEGDETIFNCSVTDYIYTISSIPDCIDLEWNISAPGSVESVSADLEEATLRFPTAGTYTITATNGMTGDGACEFEGVTKEVVVKSTIDTVAISGTNFVCDDANEEYFIPNPTLYSGITWSIDPPLTINPTATSDVINIDFPGPGPDTYTLTVTGTVLSNGCPFTSTMAINVPGDEDEFLACNNKINVSLNNSCSLDLLPEMILEGENLGNDAYILIIVDQTTGDTLEGTMITQDLLDHTFYVTVRQKCGANSCWGELLVEDKSITPLTCPDDIVFTTCHEIDEDEVFADIIGLPFNPADVTATENPDGAGWIVDGHDNCSDVLLTWTDENNSPDCDPLQEVVRTFKVTDINNGAMSTCAVDIRVATVTLTSVTWPPNWDSGLDQSLPENNPSLDACNDSSLNPDNLFCGTGDTYTLDSNGNPHPDCTGYPEGILCSNLQVIGYTDQVIPICGNAKKILRNWTVWDECEGIERMHSQIITLMNQEGLAVLPHDEFSYGTDPHVCGADIILPPPVGVTNSCHDWTYTVRYKLNRGALDPATFINEGVSDLKAAPDEDIVLNDIPFEQDSLWILYVVTDACGNSGTHFNEVRLEDVEPPIPACDLINNITLNNEGNAYATPSTFDDHSWDNCGVHQAVVTRMDHDGCGCQERTFNFLNYLGEFDGHYYYLSKDRTDGKKAVAKAYALSGRDSVDAYLAVIDSLEENNWLREQINLYTNRDVFIGLTGFKRTIAPFDLAHSWIEPGTSFRNWAAGEPSNTTGSGDNELYTVMRNDGTWDTQGLASEGAGAQFEAYVVEFDTKCGFSQLVQFCCDDIGEETMVQLRVIDKSGNHNFCMVNVNVNDPSLPRIQCPANTTIDCTANFDDLSVFGSAVSMDECGADDVDISENTTDPDRCGDGRITRTFTATDGAGKTSSCTQTITITNQDPFTYDDIVWPKDTTVFDICELDGYDPALLAEGYDVPTWPDVSVCSNVIASYDDLVFYIVDGACQKMVRTWAVVDWCDPLKTVHRKTQVIKLINEIRPNINCPAQLPAYTFTGNCEVRVDSLQASLSPNGSCADDATWTTSIDFFFGDNTSTYPDVIDRPGNNGAGVYPFGTHRVTFTVTDACGNTSSCSSTYNFNDKTAPTPYCLGEIVLPLGDTSGVEIWDVDVDFGSFDDCGEVTLSFAENTDVNVLSFDCDDVGTNVIELWVWDHPSAPLANKSSCFVSIIIQDNIGICGPVESTRVQGNIVREDNQMIDQVEVNVASMNTTLSLNDMAEEGNYAFTLPMYQDYEIGANKEGDYLNGVSTLDLVLIQRHILGMESLDSPYKIIAADINNSGDVNGLDLVELRKLILGIYTELPQNASWRFVDSKYDFPEPINPFPYQEDVNLNNFDKAIDDADFIGVKIGDVNLSAEANNLTGDFSKRSNGKMVLSYEFIKTQKGNTRLTFSTTAAKEVHGLQFEVALEGQELLAVIPVSIELEEQHIEWTALSEGKLKLSWNNPAGQSLASNEVLFEILVKGQENMSVDIEDTISPEIYANNNDRIEILDITLEKGGTSADHSSFIVDQNIPNPFKDETVIEFTIQNSGNVKFTVSDVEGKLVLSQENWYEAGRNKILLNSNELNNSGVFYYQLSSGGNSTTKKMIVLK